MTTASELPALARHLASGLDQSVADGHLPDPASKGGNRNERDSPAYIRAVRTRLIDLGYLGESDDNRTTPTPDARYIQAIKRFQRDAGLVDAQGCGDGWAGSVTWQLMQCLVSFESNQDPRRWPMEMNFTASLADNPAVRRACYLRLYAMGFFEDWRKHKANTQTRFSPADNPGFAAALARFADFARALEQLPADTQTALSPAVLRLLFSHDRLLAAVAAKTDAQAFFDKYQQQLSALVRIELWMQGYDATPGQEKFKKRTRPPRAGLRRRRTKVSTTTLAIKAFWRDNNELRGRAGRDTLSQALFRAFTTLNEEQTATAMTDGELTRQLEKIMASDSHQNALKASFKRLASGIWDGVKRVFSWLARMVAGTLRITRELIGNLARYIARKARTAFPHVTKAVEILHRGVSFGFGSAVRSDQQIFISMDRDFDHQVLIDPAADPRVLDKVLAQYRHSSQCYRAATRILSYLFQLLRAVLTATTRAWGWLQVLLSLSRLAGNLEAVRREIVAIEAFQPKLVLLSA